MRSANRLENHEIKAWNLSMLYGIDALFSKHLKFKAQMSRWLAIGLVCRENLSYSNDLRIWSVCDVIN